MFLIECLGVLIVAYAVCAVLADTIFTSERERALPAAVRASLGFVFLCTYFAAAWRIMSLGAAWLVGGALLILYWMSLAPRGIGSRRDALLVRFADHRRGLLQCLAGALLFFAPLWLSGHFGPFTEGGGDITIYADTTQVLAQHGLTAKALPGSSVADIVARMREAAGLATQPEAERDLNPPIAEFAVHRLLTVQAMSAFLYAPYGAFSFLARSSNYHVYYGVQALVYALLLVCAWAVFRRWSRRIGFIALGLVAGSHALVSVFYNTYSAQAISIGICALFLALVTAIPLFSWAGLRAYGVPSTYLLVSYPHFLSLTLPTLAVAALRRREEAPVVETPRPSLDPLRRVMRWLVLAVAGLLLVLLIVSAAAHSWEFVETLLRARIKGGMENVYMGDRIPMLSERWPAFVFGLLSQQHLLPYVAETIWTHGMMDIGSTLAAVAVVVGLAIVVRIASRREERVQMKWWLAAYGILAASAAAHVALAQSAQYTQAKGAQDVLVVLYVAMVIPLAVGSLSHDAVTKRLTRALAVLLVGFLAALVFLRADFLYRLVCERDRAGILDASYFDEARRIRSLDPEALVLFEPRKSADLYLGVQAFFGARVLPTRDLAMKTVTMKPQVAATRVMVSDLVSSADIPHLWTLAAEPVEGGHTWKAMRLAQRTMPALLLFGDDYEADFARKPRSARPGDLGMFSYVRNGTAVLYLPAGGAHTLELTFVRDNGKLETVARAFGESREPRLETVVRDGGTFWMNARLDGKELPATQSSVPGDVPTIAGMATTDSSGRVSVRATWKGVRFPESQDWVGVFPRGGDDQSRLAFAYTGARREGSVTIALPPGTSLPAYELRLFKGGSWNARATSEPIPRTAP